MRRRSKQKHQPESLPSPELAPTEADAAPSDEAAKPGSQSLVAKTDDRQRNNGGSRKQKDEDQKAKEEDQKKKTEEPEGQRAERTLRLLIGSLIVLVVGFAVLVRFAYVAPSPGNEVSLDRFYQLAANNRLKEVRFLDQDSVIVGRFCLSPPHVSSSAGRAGNGRPQKCYDPLTKEFHTSYPASQVGTQQLIEVIRTSSGADIVVDRQTGKAVSKLVSTFLFPLLMLANLFGLIFLARSSDSSLGEISGFGRIGGKGQKKTQAGSGVTFADVAGAEEAVAELREVIDYLTDPERFAAYGAAPPKGVLLFGPPGCGKTLLARATAGESGVAFFSTSGTEFVESLVGVGAARVRDLFRQVREAAPAILFIDEIDAVGRRRSGEGTSGGEREQTLNQLLVELDGFEVTSGIVLMGATNRPDILDPALLRPGRFDRHITMEAPDVHGRLEILKLHARGRPIGDEVDFEALAKQTPGFTGADLANVINEAALLAIREAPGSPISTTHLTEAVMRVLHGPQRRGQLISPEERQRLAVHEAGHAIVAASMGHGDEIHRVSIVARGRGLAQTAAGDGDRVLLTAGQIQNRLAMAMAGIAAEVLAFGESSTTAQDDIAKATALAQEMVGLHGMSTHLGRVRLLTGGNGYLGDERSLDMVSGPTMAEFDSEVRRLIAFAEAMASAVLTDNRAYLEEMVEALQEQETLEGPVLKSFLSRVRRRPEPKPVSNNGTPDPPTPGRPKTVNRTERKPQ